MNFISDKEDVFMEGIPAIYKGRVISKENFRVFVYATNGAKKLMESWEEFERHIQTGTWFATRAESLIFVNPEEIIFVPPIEKKSKRIKVDTQAIYSGKYAGKNEELNNDDLLSKAGK